MMFARLARKTLNTEKFSLREQDTGRRALLAKLLTLKVLFLEKH